MIRLLMMFWMVVNLGAGLAFGEEPLFGAVQLPTKLGVGYAVRLVDMNEDGRLDICVVDQQRILWLENPSWAEHVLIENQTKKDNVCFAPHDIDGDGKLDFAFGADWTLNTKEGGQIGWMRRRASPLEKWEVLPIGEEPTVHRMTFADLDADGKQELIVAPLLGRGTTRPSFGEAGVRLLSLSIPADPVKGPWTPSVICDDLHVTHNLLPIDLDRDGKLDLLVVSFEGVHWLRRLADGTWSRTQIGEGDQKSSPNRGASEIKVGWLSKDAPYIATIEPWHGNQVVVYLPPKSGAASDLAPKAEGKVTAPWLWTRHVIDDELLWGHAVACANLDDDPEEELIIGVRDNKSAERPCGVRIYDPTVGLPSEWKRTLVDPGSVAVEDLATGDLDGDGKVDIVAVGRATHNVKVYFNQMGKK
jgi:hypothetical protein